MKKVQGHAKGLHQLVCLLLETNGGEVRVPVSTLEDFDFSDRAFDVRRDDATDEQVYSLVEKKEAAGQ